MGKEPIIIVGGEPNSIFLEIFFKSLKTNIYKSPLIIIISKKLLQEQMKKWQTRESKFFIENNSKENSDVWIDGDPVVKIDTSSQFVRTNR